MNPIERAEQTVGGWLHHDSKESTVTGTPSDVTMTDNFWEALHHNLTLFASTVGHFLPVLKRIALNPLLDQAVEALLAAEGAGVAEEVLIGAIDMLNAAASHKTAQQPAAPPDQPPAAPPAPPVQPQQPAPAASTQPAQQPVTVTGIQPAFTPTGHGHRRQQGSEAYLA
jgi:hypothetical protein